MRRVSILRVAACCVRACVCWPVLIGVMSWRVLPDCWAGGAWGADRVRPRPRLGSDAQIRAAAGAAVVAAGAAPAQLLGRACDGRAAGAVRWDLPRPCDLVHPGAEVRQVGVDHWSG